MMRYTQEYIDFMEIGPFPGRIDPWVEDPHYFEQIHSGMIHQLLSQTRRDLFSRGYYAAIETSMQIETRPEEPDLFVRQQVKTDYQPWDYVGAAEALEVEAGVEAWHEDKLKAIFIKDSEHQLVTVVEVISPGNKTASTALKYREYRMELLYQGVNFVEIDLTRSIKRMIENQWTATYPFHIAVYLPHDHPRIIGMAFDQPLKAFALPLRGEVITVNTHSAYETAYREQGIAAQMEGDGHYTEKSLPFPSTLSIQTRQELVGRLHEWLEHVRALRHGTEG
jgi:hypothetical protein